MPTNDQKVPPNSIPLAAKSFVGLMNELISVIAGNDNTHFSGSASGVGLPIANRLIRGGPPLSTNVEILCQIVSTGPAAAVDFTDARYWLKPLYVKQTEADYNTPLATNSITLDPVSNLGNFTATHLVATNLDEAMLATHTLNTGGAQTVWVRPLWGYMDAQGIKDGLFPYQQFGFNGGGGAGKGFSCKITDNTSCTFEGGSCTVQRIITVDTTKSGNDYWVTDGVNLTARLGSAWSATWPAISGEGVKVTDSSGTIATTVSGTTPGTCVTQKPGIGDIVTVVAFPDQHVPPVAAYTIVGFERSAQVP